MTAPERIWHAIDRKGRINGCPDAHVMPCADVQEAYTEYVRADLCDPRQDERVRALKAENARLRDARDDAIDTLNAWFDRRKLAHEAIDETVLNAARGYLRTSRSGGMDKETSDKIESVIEDMANLSVFADLFARAALDKDRAP